MPIKIQIIEDLTSITGCEDVFNVDLESKTLKNPLHTLNSQDNSQEKLNFFTKIIKNHATLIDRYYIMHKSLADKIKASASKTETPEEKQFRIQQTIAAFELSVILEQCIRLYINDEDDLHVARLQRNSLGYKKWLEHEGFTIDLDPVQEKTYTSLGRLISNGHVLLNPIRLLTLRTRNLIIRINTIFNNIDNFGLFFNASTKIIPIIFAYIAWVFFLPRLMINITELSLYTLGIIGSDEEKSLPMFMRFKTQMYRRGNELTNDLPWCLSGLLMCFVFSSSIMTLGYITIAMQGYDLLRSSIVSLIEYQRLSTIYNNATDENEKKEILERMYIEYYSFALNFMNFSILVLAAGLILSSNFAMSPLLPVVGAAMAVLITLITWYGQTYINDLRNQRYHGSLPPIPNPSPQNPQNIDTSSDSPSIRASNALLISSPASITNNFSGSFHSGTPCNRERSSSVFINNEDYAFGLLQQVDSLSELSAPCQNDQSPVCFNDGKFNC